MKKSYQIETVTIKAKEKTTLNYQLKENYAKCIGFFVTPNANGISGTNFTNIQLSLNIAQMEILPHGTDAALFALTDYISREDATYYFREEGVPARSSDVQLEVSNSGDTDESFNIYFILEN